MNHLAGAHPTVLQHEPLTDSGKEDPFNSYYIQAVCRLHNGYIVPNNLSLL